MIISWCTIWRWKWWY